MDWKTMLAYVTGSVDENLLLRIEYLVAENRILRDQIKGRLQLSDAERQTLAEIGARLGKQALAELGYDISDQTVGNILKRRGIPPAPEHKKTTTWREFIRTHMDVLWATDFFSTEVWTLGGLVTFYVLFLIKLDTREVHIAGITSTPNEQWMKQMARNLTMEEWGILKPAQYLIHDGDQKFCASFKQMLEDSGVKRVPLPPRSPWLNGMAERWVQSVKNEALSRMILFGERSLRHVLSEYLAHHHTERPHQGKGNVILFPSVQAESSPDSPIECRERLGGLLKYYHHKAA